MLSRFVRAALILAVLCLTSLTAGAVTSQEYYQAATGLYQQGKYDQAVQYYQAAVQLDANNWQAYQGMGHAYFRSGKTQEALKAYDESLRLNPSNTELKKFVDAQKAANPTPALSAAPIATAKPAEKKLRFGFKAGVQTCNVSETYPDGYYSSVSLKTKISPKLALGAFLRYRLSPQFAFSPELLYSVKGKKDTATYVDSWGTAPYNQSNTWVDTGTVTLTYVELPVLARFYPMKERRFNLILGPYFGFLLSAQQNTQTHWTYAQNGVVKDEEDRSESGDIKENVAGTDFGLVIGAGYDLDHLAFELRGEFGLSNLVSNKEAASAGLKEKNSSFGVFLSYLL